MRILHTSDWHVGRTFHKYVTLEPARMVLNEIAEIVKNNQIDVVVIAGDVFDSISPKEDAVKILTEAFNRILATGCKIVAISGNHDSAHRLGFAGAFSGQSGLHLFTDVEQVATPIELNDQQGPVDFYGIPFIQPELWQKLDWMPDSASTQKEAITSAMKEINKKIKSRKSSGRRSVVLSHTFVAGGEQETDDSERAITREPLVAGGVDSVPVSTFAGPDYVALGHIHSSLVSAHNVRYPGAMLHFSFKEVGKKRGAWIVDLKDGQDLKIDWIDFPIPRNIIEIKGKFADILTNPKNDKYREYYVQAVYTDDMRETDPMRQLKQKFPYAANVIWLPENVAERSKETYRQRIENKSDIEIIEAFTDHVRNGQKLTKEESSVIEPLLTEINAKQEI